MEFSNQNRSRQIKQAFNLFGIIIVAIGLVFLWLKNDTAVLITVGVFAVYVGAVQFANLNFISFSTSNGRILIRYYPLISILKKEYEAIEFAHSALISFHIEKSMGFSDLQILIKTKRGVAEYPSISLAALSKAEIDQMRLELTRIIQSNSK